jgi:hypothetical protein
MTGFEPSEFPQLFKTRFKDPWHRSVIDAEAELPAHGDRISVRSSFTSKLLNRTKICDLIVERNQPASRVLGGPYLHEN